ncbi:lantibiotic immunity ABC transporter MutG family permease subunit [Clostridium oryzae]|uniref:ABC-2 family transporter protein n=1 Tax=Clostridium oryzae TaxID=1450648 RepID=A0A1V4IH62_9CLOT|nr:lantibiotic immunity ABC transporter MutG family permease subunit [Clostridium oryzae]OPJ59174.1 ABC-2 family transporter protein [Clostridium oryzae]
MKFYRILCSEWLKTKNTAIRKLMISIPILYTGSILAYIFTHTIKGNAAVTIFDAFFQIWTYAILPIGAGLITSLMVGQEEQAGEFNGFLGTSFSKMSMYLGKLLMVFFISTMSLLISVILLFAGLKIRAVYMPNAYNIDMNIKIFLQAVALAQGSAMPIFIIQLCIALAFGKGASIGLGCGGSLISGIIGGTRLGDSMWKFIPWTLPIRMSDYLKFFMYHRVKNINKIEVIGADYIAKGTLNFISKEVFGGAIATLLISIILIFLATIWFNRWEGRKVYD